MHVEHCVWFEQEMIKLNQISMVVVDEMDMVLSTQTALAKQRNTWRSASTVGTMCPRTDVAREDFSFLLVSQVA
jgi:hypothetical protein